MRRGMVIDLKRCIGCYSCVIACKAENSTAPGVFWARVLEKEEGKYPNPRVTFLPVLCNHCKDAPCVSACPSGATTQRDDGLVLVDYEKCVGCRACMVSCPYQARYYVKKRSSYYPDGPTPYESLTFDPNREGVVEKCTLCVHRVDKGLEPACVQACPTVCRFFGDLDDSNSELSQMLRSRYAFRLHPELGTEPSVYYLG